MLEQLPLNPNGKVDRKALPAPEKVTATDVYTAPRTLSEELLAEIWADTLQIERVDINDNFFDLGGHSLLATQIVSRITDNFHVSLPLRALFESPTVAGLSERIQTALISGQDMEVPADPACLAREGAAALVCAGESVAVRTVDSRHSDLQHVSLRSHLGTSGYLSARSGFQRFASTSRGLADELRNVSIRFPGPDR